MGLFLSVVAGGLVYSLQVHVVRDRDYFQVPMCFLRRGTPFMWLGTFFGQGNPCGRL